VFFRYDRSLASGLSGAVPGFLSGNASYISDTDSPRRRTLRLAVVELSIGGTFAVASLVNGFWIGATGPIHQTEPIRDPEPIQYPVRPPPIHSDVKRNQTSETKTKTNSLASKPAVIEILALDRVPSGDQNSGLNSSHNVMVSRPSSRQRPRIRSREFSGRAVGGLGATGPEANFEQPLWFIVVCSLVPCVIIVFLLREPASELGQAAGDAAAAAAVDAGTMTYFRFRNFRGIRRAFGLGTYPQRKLWAIVVAFEVYVFVQQGQELNSVRFTRFTSHSTLNSFGGFG